MIAPMRMRPLLLLISTKILVAQIPTPSSRPCFETRGWYSADPNNLITSGLMAATSLDCQNLCVGNSQCNIWTWYNNLHDTASLTCDLFSGEAIFMLDDITRSGCYESPCRDCTPPSPSRLTIPPPTTVVNASSSGPTPSPESETSSVISQDPNSAASASLVAGVLIGALVCAITFAAFGYRKYLHHKESNSTIRKSTVRVADGFLDGEPISSLADEGPATISEFSVTLSETEHRPTMGRVRRKNSMSPMSTSSSIGGHIDDIAPPSPSSSTTSDFELDRIETYSSSSESRAAESHIELTVRPTPPRSYFDRSSRERREPGHTRSASLSPNLVSNMDAKSVKPAHVRSSSFNMQVLNLQPSSPSHNSSYGEKNAPSTSSVDCCSRRNVNNTSPSLSGQASVSSVGHKRSHSTLSLARSPDRALSCEVGASTFSRTAGPRTPLALTRTQRRRMFGSRRSNQNSLSKSISPQRRSIKSIFAVGLSREDSVSSIASSQFLTRHVDSDSSATGRDIEEATSTVRRKPFDSPMMRPTRPRSGSLHRRSVSQPPPVRDIESSVVVFDHDSGYSSPLASPTMAPWNLSPSSSASTGIPKSISLDIHTSQDIHAEGMSDSQCRRITKEAVSRSPPTKRTEIPSKVASLLSDAGYLSRNETTITAEAFSIMSFDSSYERPESQEDTSGPEGCDAASVRPAEDTSCPEVYDSSDERSTSPETYIVISPPQEAPSSTSGEDVNFNGFDVPPPDEISVTVVTPILDTDPRQNVHSTRSDGPARSLPSVPSSVHAESLAPVRTLPPIPDVLSRSSTLPSNVVLDNAHILSPESSRSSSTPLPFVPAHIFQDSTLSAAASSTDEKFVTPPSCSPATEGTEWEQNTESSQMPSAFSQTPEDNEHAENPEITTPSAFSQPIKDNDDFRMTRDRPSFAMSLTNSSLASDMSLMSVVTASSRLSRMPTSTSSRLSRMPTSASSRAAFSRLERICGSPEPMEVISREASMNFERVMTTSEMAAEREARLARVLFNKYRGQNASLSKGDFERFIAAMGYTVDEDELESTFEDIDRSESGVIDFDEFREWCSPNNMDLTFGDSMRESLSITELRVAFDVFQRFDKDLNGEIDCNEFDSLYDHLATNDMTTDTKDLLWESLASKSSEHAGGLVSVNESPPGVIQFSSYVRWLVEKRMYRDEALAI